MAFDANADMKRVGGPIRRESAQEVGVEVYVDHSAVEIFLSTGEALATRYICICTCKDVVRPCCAQHNSFQVVLVTADCAD